MNEIWKDMRAQLDALAAAGLRREERVVESACGPRVSIGGRERVCLCSNDYLGLAGDESVRSAAIEAVKRFGVGAGASRLVSGTSWPHVELGRRLATFKRAEAAIVTSTGYMANLAAVHALVGERDLVLCDKLNHASIIDACLSSGARVRTWPHADTRRLRSLLEAHRAEHRRCLIVTDSLFSMDGDLAPLREIVDIKKEFDALLLIDEAHATGVLGEGGRGAAELLGVEHDVDVVVGTLSKALGALGGFIAGPEVLIETIRSSGRSYIYTTALPPAICAAAICALDIVQREPQRREQLLKLARLLRERLADNGRQEASSLPPLTAASESRRAIATQIIPVVIGDASAAVEVSRKLFEAGFLVPAIRPPTVPKGTSRLRVSLCASHMEQDIERFAEALSRAISSTGEHGDRCY